MNTALGILGNTFDNMVYFFLPNRHMNVTCKHIKKPKNDNQNFERSHCQLFHLLNRFI